jgi:glycosyltransferase involved in cell wall biosynthesis
MANPRVSVNILTKNRKDQLKKAIDSVLSQSFKDVEIIVVDDGSTDGTEQVLKDLRFKDLKILSHGQSWGITQSRQEALQSSTGDYIAVLDDDDEWMDVNKLKKQVEFLDTHLTHVLVGGSIAVKSYQSSIINYQSRPQTNSSIRNWMLLKNPFFTSTVMFRRESALKAGGFVKDEIDLAEDYDLWLRMGTLGKMYNFRKAFTLYSKPQYNKEKLLKFFNKQAILIARQKKNYPFYFLSKIILMLRIKFYALFF